MRYCAADSVFEIITIQQPFVPPSGPCLDLSLFVLSDFTSQGKGADKDLKI